MDRHPGCCENAGNARLAQWESACLTRRWSQVQILHRALGGPAGGHRAGECRVAQANQACAPLPDRPVLRTGNRNSLARLRRTAASFDLRCRFVKGGVPPFHTFPPVMRAANLRFAAILFFRLLGGNGQERRSPTGIARQRETCTDDAGHANLTVERRSPTGIARERETCTNNAAPRQSHGQERRSPTGIARERETRTDDAAPRQPQGCEPTHRQPRRITGTWSAGLRPASRGSAKPAPTTPRPANLTVERRSPTGIARERETCTDVAAPRQSHGGAPVSDRHRAAARNLHRRTPRHANLTVERRSPTGIARQRETCTDDAGHANLTVERRSPTGIARQRETCTDDAGHANLTVERRSPTGIARERETRTDDAAPPQSHGGAPVSDRHRAGARNVHQRRWPPQSHGGAPVSDRHRTGARNPHRRRWPPQSHGQERRSETGAPAVLRS